MGRYELATETFTWITPDEQPTMTLHPAPLPNGTSLLVTKITTSGRTIEEVPVTGGVATEIRANASSAVLSPDGARIVFADTSQQSALVVRDLTTDQEVLVADVAGTSARWSPDGTQIAYLVGDDQISCSHIDVVAADGSDVASPTRIQDCVMSGRFITDLAWITR